ncbi:hypothetical protein [Methylobacterium sp. W2]|uniref:hypothetical protein n=1 Tax=Methylobacterium sp. W2 TaxID=2598107 RepID=UPI001D0C8DDA|nr:hypothetical protein [Methylobacterium sp. W2]
MGYRIELASSVDTAPLFAALAGTRLVWTPERDQALTFGASTQAWDFVVAQSLPIVQVR